MTEQKSRLPSAWDDAKSIFSLDPLRREVDRLFHEFSSGLPPALPLGRNDARFDFWPSAELIESEKDVTIRLELPGIEQKDIDISASDNAITVTGEKKVESETTKDDRVTTERSYGAFSRVFALGHAIDASKVSATFDKGVLTLKVEKPAEAVKQAKKIEIQ